MSKKGKSKSSKQWIARQKKDEYVHLAKAKGYRSRASFKLLEIQEKDKIIKPGHVVVDIGAAPGGWSQIAKNIVGSNGHVLAIDILPIEPLEGVDIIQGDFLEDSTYEEMLKRLDSREVNVVISDIAPNFSGISAVDQPRSVYLSELALDFAVNVLAENGDFLIKIFQGEGFDEYLDVVRSHFKKVLVRKPKSSRSESREVYILGRGFKKA